MLPRPVRTITSGPPSPIDAARASSTASRRAGVTALSGGLSNASVSTRPCSIGSVAHSGDTPVLPEILEQETAEHPLARLRDDAGHDVAFVRSGFAQKPVQPVDDRAGAGISAVGELAVEL